jgi:aspartate racemase
LARVAPNPEEQAYVHDRYTSEFVKGVSLAEPGQRLLAIVERMRERESIEGLILGGTELPLILRG